jgi:hypothetical protein
MRNRREFFLVPKHSITALFDGIATSTEAPSEPEMSKKKVLVFLEILVPVLRIRIRDPVPF